MSRPLSISRIREILAARWCGRADSWARFLNRVAQRCEGTELGLISAWKKDGAGRWRDRQDPELACLSTPRGEQREQGKKEEGIRVRVAGVASWAEKVAVIPPERS